METREIRDAAQALFRWFESQEISHQDSVLVMAAAIVSVIGSTAPDKNRRIKGAEIVARMITETIKDTK